MSHFRKMLFAAAAMVASFVGSTGTASAQSNPFVCNTSFSPLVVRVEGLRELVGDIVISCTGGNGVALQAGQSLVYLQPDPLNSNVPVVSSSPTATTYAVGTGTTGTITGCWLNRVNQNLTQPNCTAPNSYATGTGTFVGLTVPAINISVTIAGTRITNRIYSSTNLTDALLFIDDPTNAATGSSTTNQNPCYGSNGVCTGLQYFFSNTGVAVGAGVANASYTVSTPLNVFQAQYGVGGGFVPNEQTITFVGVPIVQPGVGNGTRTYRIKNIRVQVANAFQVNGQIQAFISIQNPPANLVLNNAQGVVGFVQRGLFFDTIAGGPYAQCLGWNTSSGSYAVELTSGTRNGIISTGALRFTEAYGVSFKRRGFGGVLDSFDTTFNPYYVPSAGQANPTVNYNNESGFYNTTWTNGSTGSNLSSAGIASNGTRLRARFSGIPSQVRVYVSAQPVANPGSCSSTAGGIQRLRSSTSSGLLCIGQGADAPNAAYSLTTSASSDGAVEGFTANGTNVFSVTGGNAVVQGSTAAGWGGGGAAYSTGLEKSSVIFQRVTIAADGTGTFFWEVLRADDNVIDRFDFLVAISFPPTTSIVTDSNTSVTANVSGSYAPIAATGGNGYPSVPSFILPQPEDPKAIFTITNCATNLLYPFVSSVTGFNTGIAVTNASKDPFGTINETGICRVYFYGTTTGGGIDPTPQPFTKSVPSGQVATFNLLFGGPEYGIQPVVGFQGYIIISCNFRWAHGFAFISDPSNLQTAQGYLALILDTPGLLRSTGATSEALDN